MGQSGTIRDRIRQNSAELDRHRKSQLLAVARVMKTEGPITFTCEENFPNHPAAAVSDWLAFGLTVRALGPLGKGLGSHVSRGLRATGEQMGSDCIGIVPKTYDSRKQGLDEPAPATERRQDRGKTKNSLCELCVSVAHGFFVIPRSQC